MANIQNQKTASGGSVAGSWSAASPGLRGGVALLATMRACPKPRRLSSRSRLPAACSRTSLLLFRERPSSYTFLLCQCNITVSLSLPGSLRLVLTGREFCPNGLTAH